MSQRHLLQAGIITSTLFLVSCGGSNSSPIANNEGESEKVASTENYLRYMRESYSAIDTQYLEDTLARPIPIPTPAATASLENRADFDLNETGTNVQVRGVDEQDSIKFDGNILLSLKNISYNNNASTNDYQEVRSLNREMLQGAVEIDPSFNLQLDPAFSYKGMLKHPDYVSALGQKLSYYDRQCWSGSFCILDDFSAEEMRREIKIQSWRYRDAETPLIPSAQDILIDGSIITSRAVGNKLYIVSQFSPNYPSLARFALDEEGLPKAQEITAETLEIENLAPYITINNTRELLVDDTKCRIENEATRKEYYWNMPQVISITVIDITDPTNWYSSCHIGNTYDVFMSQENLYLAQSLWQDNQVEINQFAINDSGIEFSATGRVEGSTAGDSYYFGEVDGKLVYVNTIYDNTGSPWWGNPSSRHQLSVLEANGDTLDIIAQLPNAEQPAPIGKPGEQIYSVRILGRRAYIVTFDRIDPLYVIDLDDPSAPEILGELEIPGYSAYLHPISENLLIGIGKDATEENNRTLVQGLNIRLFDISNPTQPSVIESLHYGERGSEANVLHNPHAFSYQYNDTLDQFRFAINMKINEDENPETNLPASHYHAFKHHGLYQFEVNLNTPALNEVATSLSTDTQYRYSLDRMILDDDAIYRVHENQIDVIEWGTGQILRSFYKKD